MELLTQGHRHRILQLGTTHLQDALELGGLGIEGGDQCFQRVQGGVGAVDHGHAETGGVGIVGGLTLVDVVIGVDDVVAALGQAHDFEGDVGQDFVGVHVDGGAGTTLVNVDRELVEAFAGVQHQVAGFYDLVSNFRTDGTSSPFARAAAFLVSTMPRTNSGTSEIF